MELKKSKAYVREKELRKLVQTLQPQAQTSQPDDEPAVDGDGGVESSDDITGDICGSITGDEP